MTEKAVTIADAQRLKRQACAQVDMALQEFTKQTGLLVNRIDIRAIDTSSMEGRSYDYRVELEVELP